MFDIHCHLLPGIDDGPATVEDSVDLARTLAAAGVTTVAATPHLREDHPRVVPAELADRRADLARRLEAEGVPLDVVTGAEVDLLWAQDASAEELRLASYGQRGTDLLVETPYGPLPAEFERHLFRLAVAGFRILLAHPERNPTFQADPGRLRELVRRGTLVQVTMASAARSPRRSRSARLARDLIDGGFAHVLASDSHGAAAPDRTRGNAGVEAVRAYAHDRADWMVTQAPEAVLTGNPVQLLPADGASVKNSTGLGRQMMQLLRGALERR